MVPIIISRDKPEGVRHELTFSVCLFYVTKIL